MKQSTGVNQSDNQLVFDQDPSLLDAQSVAQAMHTDMERGLSTQEAQRRLEQFGTNTLASAPEIPKWKKFLAQFNDPLVFLLLAATVISGIAWVIEKLHNPAEAEALPFDCIVIVLILVLNAVLGYMQEAKAEQAVAALAKMTAAQTTVLRDGERVTVESSQIVPGDIVLLAEGDNVAADGRLVHAAALHIAEASLTGESVPVSKNVATLEQAKALGDRSNMVFNGTAVTQGTGKVIITATGMSTQVGHIADMLQGAEEEPTPLQKEIARVSKMLGIAVCVIAVGVLATLTVVYGLHSIQDVIDSLLLAVSLAVAAVPEGLAAILTVVLALGVQRMAKHHAIVKKLSSVETLGSASVICSDKTGTLTRNEMTVQRVLTLHDDLRITGTGYEPKGELVVQHHEPSNKPNGGHDDNHSVANEVAGQTVPSEQAAQASAYMLAAGAIANDGKLNDDTSIVGDPTEVSLIVAARKIQADIWTRHFTRIAEIPFNSERKRMSVVGTLSMPDADEYPSAHLAPWSQAADGEQLVAFAKGAPDVLLQYCDYVFDQGEVRALTRKDREHIISQVEQLSKEAYRTLGQAYRITGVTQIEQLEGAKPEVDLADQPKVIEQHMVWLGMVGIIDPPRTEVRDSVAQAHGAGVRTVMITGDHPLTAARIAQDLGIIEQGEQSLERYTLTGNELDQMNEREFSQAVARTSVYARVAPEHKLRIVRALQGQGNIVAMTGDGVNDAPAVKSADIGVAMGITGTEVTKESAAMILADDNFSTIVAAVREGRAIFDNIRKFLRYLLSSNAGEVFTVFFGVLLAGFLGLDDPASAGVTVPLLAVQLLWINLLTDAAPAMAMGVDPSTENVMNRGPRKLTDRVIDRRMWSDVAVVGLLMAAVTLIGMDLYLPGGLITDDSAVGMAHADQIVMARTMGFTILVFAQLFNAFAARSGTRSAFHGMFANAWLWGAVALSIVLQLAVIYIPFLNIAFGTMPLYAHQWLECIGLAALVLVGSEIYKCIVRLIDKQRA